MTYFNVSFEFNPVMQQFGSVSDIAKLVRKINEVLLWFTEDYETGSTDSTYLDAKLELTENDFGLINCKIIWDSNSEFVLQEISDVWRKVGEQVPPHYLTTYNDRYDFIKTDNLIKTEIMGDFTKRLSASEIENELHRIRDVVAKFNEDSSYLKCITSYTEMLFKTVTVGIKIPNNITLSNIDTFENINIATNYAMQFNVPAVLKTMGSK